MEHDESSSVREESATPSSGERELSALDAAAETAMRECRPISNVRSSADYRREMVGVLTNRAIRQAAEFVQ